MTNLSLFAQNDSQTKNLLPKDGEVLFYPDFFQKNESDNYYQMLLDRIEWQQDKIKFFGKEINLPRLTAWYGDQGKTYTYSGIPMQPHAWTQELLEIKRRIEEVAKVNFSSVLLNHYRDGKDKVAWHSDDEPELGSSATIGSVSFGEERIFKLRHLSDKELPVIKLPLTHGSFLLMRGETQHFWEHEIPKTSVNGQNREWPRGRINLTFRVIK